MDSLPQTIRELTSLRFFAAMSVVLFHVHDRTPALAEMGLFIRGGLGVDVFFVLSGFILAHVYIEQYRAGRFSYVAFLSNRFARIYPLHLVMTLVFVALYVVASRAGFLKTAEGMDWQALPIHLAALHAWGFVDHHAWNFPSWSISAEWFAYLLFPLFAAAALKLRVWPALIVAVVSLCVAYAISELMGAKLSGLMYNYGIARIFFEFAYGVALLRLNQTITIPRAQLIFWPLAAGFFLLAVWGVSDLVLILMAGAGILLLAQMARGKPNIMRHPILVYLGEISYSTYMVHYLVEVVYIGLAGKLLGSEMLPMTAWLGLIAAIYIASIPSYHLIELPARSYLRRRKQLAVSKPVG